MADCWRIGMRTLAMDKAAEPWSLTSLREKLIKTGAKVGSHGRYTTFQMAEVAVPRQMFQEILSLIARLRAPPAGQHDERSARKRHRGLLSIDKRRYGLPTDEDWGTEPRSDAAEVRLRNVLRPGKTTIDYLYDFGDCWEHQLTVTDIRTGDPDLSYPRYIAGERNAPPEDCGGIPGFYQTLDAAADPKRPNHAEAKKWLDNYDPNAFDELPIKYALSRIANQRNAAKVRLAKKKPSAITD
jgi:Plasmid pRiA4b ORF-3-like protein